jgi:peptide/nickel transport system substrate-binding protein
MLNLIHDNFGSSNYTGVYARDVKWVNSKAQRFDYNPAQALERLKKLGVNSKNKRLEYQGKVLELRISYDSGNSEEERSVGILKENAASIGLRIIGIPLEGNTLYSKLEAGDFELTTMVWQGGFSSFPVISALLCDSQARFHNKSCTQTWEKEWDALYRKGLQELNLTKRREIAFQIQQLEAQQQPYVYLPTANTHFAWNKKIRGYYPPDLLTANGWSRRELLWKQP